METPEAAENVPPVIPEVQAAVEVTEDDQPQKSPDVRSLCYH